VLLLHLFCEHPDFRLVIPELTQFCRGQQISWLAARSIVHRFIRLYDASLPEKPTDEEYVGLNQEISCLISCRRRAITFFPTPSQVVNTELAVLRTAGLSARKAEYSKFSKT